MLTIKERVAINDVGNNVIRILVFEDTCSFTMLSLMLMFSKLQTQTKELIPGLE